MKRYAAINLVASEKLELLQYKKYRDRIFKGLCATVGVLLCLIAMEAAVLVYQYTARVQAVPEELVTQFQTQQSVRATITKKMDILNNSEKERKRILEVVGLAVQAKPQDVFFTSLQAGETGSMQLDCFSKEPEIFHQFAEQLNSQKNTFRNAKVERIIAVEPAKVYKTSSIKTEFF